MPPPAAAAIADVLQRGAAAGKAALREFTTAVRGRAGDWKSAYARLAGSILSLSEKRSTASPDFEPEYASSPGSAD